MKKKFSIWLNIVTICLCVCAIAIGVYAATSATLQVTGQIGFTAHGLEFTATAKAKGYVTNPDDKDTYQSDYCASISMTNNRITLPQNMYFTDLVEDTVSNIEIVISITNNSQFDIYGVVSATSKETNIGIDKSVGLFNLDKKVNTTVDSIDIVITLSVIPETDGSYTAIEMPTTAENLTISIDFNKGKVQDLFQEEVVDENTTNYYLEMGTEDGTANGTPLKWYAFAKEGNNGYEGQSKTTALTTGSYYFISEKALLVNTSYEGVQFNSKTTYEKTEAYKKLDYAYESTVRPLVNDGSDNANSVYSKYGMAGSPIYNAITNRDLAGETYKWYYNAHNNDYTNYEEYTTNTTYNQTLWLLSYDEATNTAFFAKNDARKAHPVGGAEDDYAYWWLRSPGDASSDGYAHAWCVYGSGSVNFSNVYSEDPGVRPAFQINIAV